MSATMAMSWSEANQHYLVAAIGVVRSALVRHIARLQPVCDAPREAALGEQEQATSAAWHLAAEAMPSPAALEVLGTMFGLSAFERDLLVLCSATELDSTFASLCAEAQGDPARAFPTFGLALATLAEAHWSALTPAAPLRRWRLIEVGSGASLTLSPLRIDERILHYLAGVQHLDERLASLVEPLHDPGPLARSHHLLAERIAALWSPSAATEVMPVVQLCGTAVADNRAIAVAACAAAGLRLSLVSAQTLPLSASDLDGFIRLWSREAILSHCALLLECHHLDPSDRLRARCIDRLIESLNGPLLLSSDERQRTAARSICTFDVHKPSPAEQRQIWRQALSGWPVDLNHQVQTLASQFNLDLHKVRAVCADVMGRQLPHAHYATSGADELPGALWDACRMQARPHLDDLAQRIEPAADWDDLVLPELQLHTLRSLATHVRQRSTVYDQWGFAAKSARGLGISALFAGVSGTGKTMAAEVLAHELRLDLYRIDLSAVVSKYIGETEKNLRRVFDAAEEGGAILLFDEADALFGKRSEVKDSHDRYANIEVSYLLQRMEAYRGLAILTTNLKAALDNAFLRRLRFIVQFPFPDAAQRAEIWRRIFPVETPTDNLDIRKLACLNVAGGNIRNIALNAAFFAADAAEPVRMTHVLRAAQEEYMKLEKALTAAETSGWV